MSYTLTDGSGLPLTDGFGHPLSAPYPGNMVLGWLNGVLTGPVTATNSADGFGPEQLQNDQGSPTMAWRTSVGTTAGSLLLSRPAGTPWRGFGLFRSNLTPAASVTWNVLSGGTVVYSAASDPVVPGVGQAVHVAILEQIGDAMQVNISDPTNPDGYLSVALMFAGPVWQPGRNYGYASAMKRMEQTSSVRTRAGGEVVRNDWQARAFDLVMPAVAPEEVVPRLVPLETYARLGGNIFFIPRPGGPNQSAEALFGRLIPSADIGFGNNSARTRTWRATISERL